MTLQHGNFGMGKNRKVLLIGTPKDSGKTTFALSTGAHGTVLDLQYDFGNPTIPPGVDPNNIWVKTYPAASPEVSTEDDRWTPARNVGAEIIADIHEIRNAFKEQRPIKLHGEEEIPLPGTLVLDGLVGISYGVMQWILAVNNVKDVDDFESGFIPYAKRLDKLTSLYNMVIPLPCNVILVTWYTPEMKTEKNAKGKLISVATGRFLPDIGGKLDLQGTGKVDAALRCYSLKTAEGVKYFVATNGGTTYPGLGIRGVYGHPNADKDGNINVTIPRQDKKLPYEVVFGKE